MNRPAPLPAKTPSPPITPDRPPRPDNEEDPGTNADQRTVPLLVEGPEGPNVGDNAETEESNPHHPSDVDPDTGTSPSRLTPSGKIMRPTTEEAYY